MKNTLVGILTAISLCTYLHADYNEATFGPDVIPELDKVRPCQFTTDGNATGNSKFKKEDFEHEHVSFADVAAYATCVFHFTPCYREGLFAGIGYDFTRLNWKENPFFEQEHFKTAVFSLGGFTDRIPHWRWQGEIDVNVDTDHFNLSHYTTYDIFAWGRYRYSENVGVHVGLIVQTGMKIDWVYPIVGFDWQLYRNFKLNLVFPVNISAIYSFNSRWSLGLAARVLESRHRVGKHEPLSKGLFTYRSVGGELALNYTLNEQVYANIHVGYTLGGMLKVANRHYRDKEHFKFGAAPYFGGEVEWKF